jgi:hypothetical protein
LSLNSFPIAGCARGERIDIGVSEVDGFVLKEIEMENVRFEPQGLPVSIQPALAYWLRRGDMIAPRWDTHEFHWERKGAMCGFVDNISTEDCQICNYCVSDSLPTEGPPCMGIHPDGLPPVYSSGALEVVADPGFIQTENSQQVLEYHRAGEFIGACSNSAPQSFFTPAASGLYRLRSSVNATFKGDANGEIKLHVVEAGEGLAQKTAYQLTSQTVDGVNYWTWTIEGSPLWLENFSPNLRVSYIRIFRGECADGSAEGKQCAVPSESALVRPSHIFFLPDFQGTVSGHPGESSHRCYNNPNASDGNFIKLDICRERYDYPLNQTTQKIATPTYESIQSDKKLTWVVVFNTSDGADADLATPDNDPMPPDSRLIIEFTIQAN